MCAQSRNRAYGQTLRTLSMEINERAYAKLNLTLDIVGKHSDGYHDMKMIMQSIDLYDNVTITVKSGSGIVVSSDKTYLPCGHENLAYRAAEVFLEETGISDVSVNVKLEKNIPICSGMAGGSADAAAILRGLNRMLETNLDADRLRGIGSKIGSDVAFCVEGGTVLALGRGDEIHPLKPLPDCRFIVLKPSFSVSTPRLFSAADNIRIKLRPDIDGAISALENGNLTELSRRCFNIFEVALSHHKRETIEDLESKLLSQGALCACMTGTGSAVYGLFDNEEKARSAYEHKYGDEIEKFIAKPTRTQPVV